MEDAHNGAVTATYHYKQQSSASLPKCCLVLWESISTNQSIYSVCTDCVMAFSPATLMFLMFLIRGVAASWPLAPINTREKHGLLGQPEKSYGFAKPCNTAKHLFGGKQPSAHTWSAKGHAASMAFCKGRASGTCSTCAKLLHDWAMLHCHLVAYSSSTSSLVALPAPVQHCKASVSHRYGALQQWHDNSVKALS